MGDEAKSYQVTSQVPVVHCDWVTHTQKYPAVTLADAKVTEGLDWSTVNKAVLK